MPLGEIIFQVLVYALAVIIPLWALVAGGRAERLSAIFFIVATVASKSVEQMSPPQHAGVIFLGIDGLMALGFLILALVYRHLWIALMMFTMAGVFSIHAFYEMTDRDLDWTFALMSNLATLVLLTSLAIGVWTSRRRAPEQA
ncbi:hypothetical protein [Phenylobacterium sp.]|jgi:hypothetical protein|uniref:hypothetical protein n=1 Tax=Phenylobacterium sp. TaxID=1871053 RepID=UPI0025EAFCCF|nr:hypothetical protein [Phenylobacterium sp.]MCA3719962.1 hypothetical protein [Phenylobacterium sp.]